MDPELQLLKPINVFFLLFSHHFYLIDLLACLSQVAFQQADFAGWNLWAAINHRPLLPFRLEIRALINMKVKIAWLFIA